MTKKKPYYIKDENGKWTQISKLPDFNNPEQLSFSFDVDQDIAEKLNDGKEAEFTVSVSTEEIPEVIEQLGVDSDDVYDALLDEIDKLRNCWLNAMYYIDHARTMTDILHSDKVTQNELRIHKTNILELLEEYLTVCTIEYNSERIPILQSIAANKLN